MHNVACLSVQVKEKGLASGRNITPGYDMVAQQIAGRIDRGEYIAGTRLPSILELASEYDVAAVTVRRAITQLCKSGKLQTVPGVGTFAAVGCPLTTVVMVIPRGSPLPTTSRLARMDLIDGAADACARNGPRLVVATDGDRPEEFIQPRHGFLLCPDDTLSAECNRWVQTLLLRRAPWASAGYDHDLPNYIARDMTAALRKGLSHLYRLGHRRIVVLGRNLASGKPLFPEAAFPEMPDLRVVYRSETMSQDLMGGENTALVGRVLKPVLEEFRPTALFAGTDGFAAAALEWMDGMGIKTPGDISFLAFSRRNFSAWRGRALTRVDNPHEAIGRRAVEELIKAAAGGGYRIGRVLVEPELVEGATCGSPGAEPATA